MDNPVTPPSLIGAGVAQQPQSPASMIDAIRSQGSMPAQAMQQMAPPPQANVGLAAGSGVLSALGGRPGANPYLAQAGQQGAQQSQQQMEMARLAQKSQQQKQAMEMKRHEAMLKVSQELLQGDSEDGRKVGARGLQTYAKSVGLDIPDSVLEGMATKRLTPAEYNDALKKLGMGVDPKSLMQMYPALKPQDIEGLQRVAKDPVALKAVGLQTPDERKKSAADTQLAELKVISERHPEIKGKYGPEMLAIHRKLNGGKEYTEGTPESQTQAFEMAKLSMLREEEQRDIRKITLQEGMRSRLQEQRDISMERRMTLKADQAKATKETVADQKKKQAVVVAKTFLNQFDDYIDKLDKAGFLPKDSGVYEAGRSAVKQGHTMIPGISEPNDPLWRGWLDLQGNMIGFARSVQNDIGPRAMAAFNQAVRVSERPPTKEGLKKIARQMREQLDASETGQPQGPGAGGPLKPTLPAGTKMEGGKLISESGKYEWNGKAWTPRTQ
jgi:hypothetical protein